MKSGSLGPTPSSMPSSPLQYGFPIAFPRSRGEHEFLKARAQCLTQEMREMLATRASFSPLSSSHLSLACHVQKTALSGTRSKAREKTVPMGNV